MAETFEYPNSTSPTKTLTFNSNAGTDARSVDGEDSISFNQISDTTIGGTRMTANLGSNYNRYTATYVIRKDHASYTDWADVLSFFGTSYANGGANTFAWTDSESTERTVRLVSPSITKQVLSNNYIRVSFTLEEEN